MAEIPPDEIQYSSLSLFDEIGKVFHWRGRVCRGIKTTAANQVRDLFASGFINELTERGLFPRSEITDYKLEDFALVIEHEVVPVVTYPHEWSFDMFRDAALAVLEVNEIAARYGWSLKDCHPYNVLFNGSRPIYIDLGSFIPATRNTGLISAAGFLSCYWYPLSIWASGDAFLAQRIISCSNGAMPPSSWVSYQHPVMRRLSSQRSAGLAKNRERVLRRGARIVGHRNKLRRPLRSFVDFLPAELFAYAPDLLRQKIMNLPPPPVGSEWHSYQDEYFAADGLAPTPRFERILEIIETLDCESTVELAGNQGLLSLLVANRTAVQRVISTDSDSEAVNRFHKYCRNHSELFSGKTLQAAVLNFMGPEENFYTEPPATRFQSDLVIALAITHHLTLSQDFPLRKVMQTIASYTSKFALVEFMPLGLWNGQTAAPLPEWYTLEWFQQAFKESFELESVEELEANRVLLLGRLRKNSGGE